MSKFLIEWRPGDFIIGEKIQTRGNDEEYPTFISLDNKKFSCHIDRVIKMIQEVEVK